ncbi:hypothetical protein UIS43_15960 [Nocardiopsis sp. LDBS0036]|uniref:hypothetical protein n=1 Tax=Nocardiopsis sp. LDBS0036 TaxID=3104276 RepID=UPI003518F4D8
MEIQSNDDGRDASDRTSRKGRREVLVHWTKLLAPSAILLIRFALPGELPVMLEESGEVLDILLSLRVLVKYWQAKRTPRWDTGEKG